MSPAPRFAAGTPAPAQAPAPVASPPPPDPRPVSEPPARKKKVKTQAEKTLNEFLIWLHSLTIATHPAQKTTILWVKKGRHDRQVQDLWDLFQEFM